MSVDANCYVDIIPSIKNYKFYKGSHTVFLIVKQRPCIAFNIKFVVILVQSHR
jgi:hypothetical protein